MSDNQLAPHQVRVVEEKLALDENIKKLQKFIEGKSDTYLGLPEEEVMDLNNQLQAMTHYSLILQRRINRF
jgi:hypothetical protein